MDIFMVYKLSISKISSISYIQKFWHFKYINKRIFLVLLGKDEEKPSTDAEVSRGQSQVSRTQVHVNGDVEEGNRDVFSVRC